MLLLNNLSLKEKTYLAELYNSSKIGLTEISADTLYSLKRNVLEFALQTVNIPARKKQVLQKIINKIIAPPFDVLETELTIPEERRIEQL